MALQGTIDSFPLVDVLQLLATSNKSGRLELVGDRGRGSLWLTDGELVAGAVQGRPVAEPADAVWELLRFSDGSFEFSADEPPPADTFEAAPVPESVERASGMLGEWTKIEKRVPSLRHRVELVAVLPGGEVRLSAEDWAIVVGAGPQPLVGDLLSALGLEEFHGCRRLAEMVDRGLVSVHESLLAPLPDAPLPAVATPAPMSEPAPEPVSAHEPAGHEPAGMADLPLSQQFPEPAAPDGVAVAEVEPVPAPLPEPPAPVAAPAPEDSTRHLADHGGRNGTSGGGDFPQHFPIDDLVGDPASDGSWDAAGTHAATPAWADQRPVQAAEAFGTDGTAPVADEATAASGPVPEPEPAPADTGSSAAAEMPEDDVLAQIGRLSPKAAEAIAAALGDGDGRGTAG